MNFSQYDKYKDSGFQWIGKIPKHWKISKFKHYFSFSKSINTSKNPTILSLTQQGIKVRDISTNEGQIASSYDNYTKVHKNDIVLNPMDLISGFVDCSPVEGVISPAYYTLKPNNDIIPEYYNYYLQKHYYEKIFFPFGEGVSVDHRWTLKKEDFLNFSLIKPPLDEQKQIANYLNKQLAKVDTIIQKNKKLVDLLEEKRISLIGQVVTKGLNPDVPMKDSDIDWIGEIPQNWQITKIRFLGTLQNGISKSSEYFGQGYPFVGYGDVYNNEELPSTVIGKANTSIDERINYSVKKNDIFFTRTSETIEEVGITSLCTETIENATFSGFLIRLRLFKNIDINVNFLKYYLQSISIRHYFAKMMVIVTRASLGQNLLNNLSVIIPPKEEQIDIIHYLDVETSKIDKTINKIQKNISLLEEYKTSLIHHVITGKIDVTEEI